VVLRGFRENFKAVIQELERRIAKIQGTVAEFEGYVQSHLFSTKELMREWRQRRGKDAAEIGSGSLEH